jgi:tRNA A-37 threonylcarbamoyl transferase component Bud32
LTKPLSPDPGDETRLGESPAGDATRRADPASDETRLADTASRERPSSSAGWLSSSGAIDHGRFPPGTVLGNRYRIVGRLGRGGMGEVFRADDLKLGQPVALKFLPPEVDRDPARLTQLHSEVRMARQVSHPNVCRVYDIDEIEGHTFLSMEYVDGEDLASLLRRIGRFPEDRGLEIARQICAGLAAAHERGVVHRDFKPANVMVDGTGRVRITDFGLAGSSGETIRAGTPAYMAPEQLAGGEVTARSDIYALGLVLYELFTGKRALEAASLAELIRRREQAEVVLPSALVRDLSPEIDRAVMRCLAPEPDRRPSSALQVAAALPGGDPLAAALAAGETPSPQMVAAAGEDTEVAPRTALALMAFIVIALITAAFISDRVLLAGRFAFEKSADVLEDRAREAARAAGYTDRPTDTARGVGVSSEAIVWLGGLSREPSRFDVLWTGQLPLLRFWYRTSPRPMMPSVPNWKPTLNDPPATTSGMVSVMVDDQGRLLELVAVPPQHDPEPGPATRVDWSRMFVAAGLDITRFNAVSPEWTPRVFAEERVAWQGPMPGFEDRILRVEAASYGGRPVAFQTIWPWTRPVRMVQPPTANSLRVLMVGGTLFIVTLMIGAIMLVRSNLRSGRADTAGAARLARALVVIWLASWIIGARHVVEIDAETDLFFQFLSIALLNVVFTWLFYLALEPFVRRYCPDFLISWSRLLQGHYRDPRVARDLLIGLAGGLLLGLTTLSVAQLGPLFGGPPPSPRLSSVEFMLGPAAVVSSMLRVIPNALQGAMVATFAYVLLLAAAGRRRWVPILLMVLLFLGVIVSEGSGDQVLVNAAFGLLLAVPVIFIFVRYGLVASATMLGTNILLNTTPLTLNFSRLHAPASLILMVLLLGTALFAFHQTRAGAGLLKRLA